MLQEQGKADKRERRRRFMQICLFGSGPVVKNHMTVICAGWGATEESEIKSKILAGRCASLFFGLFRTQM